MEYIDRRQVFYNSVINVLSDYKDDALLYGSFKTKNFHYDNQKNETYSDIDLYCKYRMNFTSIKNIAINIKDDVKKETDVNIRVSLRTQQIHTCDLDFLMSTVISEIESLLKLSKDNSINHKIYQISKFLLKYINIIAYSRFHLHPILFKNSYVPLYILKLLISIKLNGFDETMYKDLFKCFSFFSERNSELKSFIQSILFENEIELFIRKKWKLLIEQPFSRVFQYDLRRKLKSNYKWFDKEKTEIFDDVCYYNSYSYAV